MLVYPLAAIGYHPNQSYVALVKVVIMNFFILALEELQCELQPCASMMVRVTKTQ
jgi:hypothetical protein